MKTLFNKSTQSHISSLHYAISGNGLPYYLKLDECEVLINGSFYTLEPDTDNIDMYTEYKGGFYVRANGSIHHLSIVKF